MWCIFVLFGGGAGGHGWRWWSIFGGGRAKVPQTLRAKMHIASSVF